MPNAKYPILAAGGTETKSDGPSSVTLDEQSLIESLAQELKRNPKMQEAAMNRWRVRKPEEERMRSPTFNELAGLMLPVSINPQRI